MPRTCIVQNTLSGYNVPLYMQIAKSEVNGLAIFVSQCDSEGLQKLPDLLSVAKAEVIKASSFSEWINRKTGIRMPSVHLLRAVWRYRPEVVFVDGLSSVGTALVLKAILPLINCSLVWWSLGVTSGAQVNWRRRGGNICQWIGTRGSIVLAYGKHAARYFEMLGVPRERLIVGFNTIDEQAVLAAIEVAQYRLAQRRRELGIEREPVLIFCGTLKRGKRVGVLLEALALLQVGDPLPPTLIVIGDGEERVELESLASNLGVSPRVHFIGAKNLSEVSEYFLLGDIAVLPGLGGLMIPHAFAHGLPVICGPADGMEQELVINGQTGILLPHISPSSLAEAIAGLLKHPERCRCLGLAGRELVTTTHSIKAYRHRVHQAALAAVALKRCRQGHGA